MKLYSQLIDGVTDDTTSHGEAWHFMQLGRLMERADNTSRLLDVKYFLLLPSLEEVGGAVDDMEWSILLRSATALVMYRAQIRPHYAGERRRLPDARHCVPAFDPLLSAARGGVPARDHGHAVEAAIATPWSGAWATCTTSWRIRRCTTIITAGLHEYLDNLQRQLNGVGDADQRDVLRRCSPSAAPR